MPARSRLGPRRAGVPFCPAPSRTTRVKRAGRANGKGIFLLRGTASGEVVLFMRSPRSVDPSHVGALLETRKQHADCAVHVVDSNTRRAYVDDSYCTGQPDGGWYMMNHSTAQPNVKLEVRNGRPIWVSLRYIAAGEELLWTYSLNVPAAWNDEPRASSCRRPCAGRA